MNKLNMSIKIITFLNNNKNYCYWLPSSKQLAI